MRFLQKIHQSPYKKKKRNKTDIKTEADKELGWYKTNIKAKSKTAEAKAKQAKSKSKTSRSRSQNSKKQKPKQAEAKAKQAKKTGMKEREMEIIE